MFPFKRKIQAEVVRRPYFELDIKDLTVIWSHASGTNGTVMLDGKQVVKNTSDGMLWITADQGRITIALSPGESCAFPFSFDLVKRGTSAA